MADTHINAFYAAVDEAEQAVVAAQADLEKAKAALAVKKQEDGVTEDTTVTETPEVKTTDDTPTDTPKKSWHK